MSDLLHRLRRDQKVVATGVLSLDRDKAREKLRAYRLPSPHYYVLQFVRAASILGAEEIDFQISPREVLCRFPAVFDPSLLEDLWGNAFAARHDDGTRALHCLALGVASAQALAPASIRIETADVCLRITDDVEQLDTRESSETTVIRVDEGFRVGHLAEFVVDVFGEPAEARLLRRYCADGTLRVFVNGVAIRAAATAATHRARFASEGVCGHATIDRAAEESEVVLVRDGIRIGVVPTETYVWPMRGVLESNRLQTDLSGLQVVADDMLEILIKTAVMPAYHAALLRDLERSQLAPDAVVQAGTMLANYVRDLRASGRHASAETHKLLEWVYAQPLFETATEPTRPASLAEFRGAVVRKSGARLRQTPEDLVGAILYVHTGIYDARMRQRLEFLDALMLAELLVVEDVTRVMLERELGAQQRLIWAAQSPTPRTQWPYQRVVEFEGLQGCVYLPLTALGAPLTAAGAGGFLHREGRLVRRVEPGPLMLGVWLDGAPDVDTRWTDIARDDRVDELVSTLCFAAIELGQAYALAVTASGIGEQRPGLIDAVVKAIVTGHFTTEFFKLFGYSPERARAMVRAHARLRELDSAIDHLPFAVLGPMAQVPAYRMSSGGMCSLTQLVDEYAELPVVVDGMKRPPGKHVLADLTQDYVVKYLRLMRARAGLEDPGYLPEPEPGHGSEQELPVAVAPIEPSPSGYGDALLDALVGALLEARGDRRELFDDHLARSFSWAELTGGALCAVSGAGVRIDPNHPLVACARGGGRVSTAALASVVYSRVNAWYRSITDHDESELQARLLGLGR